MFLISVNHSLLPKAYQTNCDAATFFFSVWHAFRSSVVGLVNTRHRYIQTCFLWKFTNLFINALWCFLGTLLILMLTQHPYCPKSSFASSSVVSCSWIFKAVTLNSSFCFAFFYVSNWIKDLIFVIRSCLSSRNFELLIWIISEFCSLSSTSDFPDLLSDIFH